MRDVRAILLGVLSLALVDIHPSKGEEPCPESAIRIEPGVKIQDAVDKASEGATFCLAKGVHRQQRITPKNAQTFLGERGATLSGARLLTSFNRQGQLWVGTGITVYRAKRGSCATVTPTCNMPGKLFIDDKPYVTVRSRSALSPGQAFFDYANGKIYFADDPNGHRVEVAEFPFAFDGRAKNVTIKNIIVEKYDSPAQEGAINGRFSTNWIVSGVELRWNSAVGIRVGAGGQLLDSNVHHNGQLGVSAGGKSMLLKNNEVWANNAYGFDVAWEAGGVKAAEAEDFKVIGNRVHDNGGTGIWCDINCRNALFEGNTAERNTGPGLFYEISFDGVMRGNVLRHNGTSGFRSFWNSDIQIAGSENVKVFDNDITVNPNGGAIMMVDQGRKPEGRWTSTYKTRNNYIHNNRIRYEGDGTSGGVSDRSFFNENYSIIIDGNNRFNFNTYKVKSGASAIFLWSHSRFDWAGFQGQGQEPDGTLSYE
jgi:hypothetical protein